MLFYISVFCFIFVAEVFYYISIKQVHFSKSATDLWVISRFGYFE